jgi:UDP-glucose:(heptosyl)LPS alpha-1,3-glucosyltransferase
LRTQLPPIIQIVRRFGCVGGMESYVWNLAHELVKLDIQTEIICEETFGKFDPRIVIHQLPKSKPRPRWKSMQSFRQLVAQYITDVVKERSVLVHSHERSSCHHVTTFHGPPIAANKSIIDRLIPSRRISAWRNMEKDELFSTSTKQVLFVSSILKEQLIESYPELKHQKVDIAYPGVHPNVSNVNKISDDRDGPPRAVFVGTEWKRKGLELAVKIINTAALDITLDVYGPSKEELPDRIVNHPRITVVGWKETIPWESYEVLIHPAKKEPFGMVIAEARANGLKVLVSSEVGSTELGFKNIAILELSSSIDQWSIALETLITKKPDKLHECLWTWSDLAKLHKESFYPDALKALANNE